MQVTIIGTGNVATVLGKLIYKNHHTINQVYGRNLIAVNELANSVNAEAISDINKINNDAEIYLVAVSDNSIESICNLLKINNKIIIHTAGSVSLKVLKNVSTNYGVLYPIQSIRKAMNITIPIPFLIDGSNELTKKTIEEFAKSISNNVVFGDDEKRFKLHIAAVFACNFVNYLYMQSEAICLENNIDFSLLQALIEETANRLKYNKPKDVFTGPAVRKDFETIKKHLQQLKENPPLQSLYKLMSDKIIEH